MNLDKLVNQNKFFRRLVLVWAICLITYITLVVFSNVLVLTTAGAAAYGSGMTILTAVIGLYQYLRSKDDELFLKKDKNVIQD